LSAGRLIALGGAAALAGILAAGTASAGGQQQPLSASSEALVRGGAPMPDFHLNFLLDEPGHLSLGPASDSQDLEIALSSPKTGVFHFLFSPRPQFGYGYDPLTGGTRGFAGLTWNLFDTHSLFGSFGLAGSYDPGLAGPLNDPTRHSFGPPLMLHSALELGYRLGEQHNVSLRLDEGRSPELRLNSETSDNVSLRYGLKF